MNRTPVPEKTQTEQPTPVGRPPRTPAPDLTTAVLFTVAAITILLVILCLSLLHFGPASSGRETEPETTEPPNPSHVAVVYPTTPTRDDYRLNGNGAAINSETISASSAILVSLKDYSVKASVDADARIYPASMTKIMTLIVACENLEDGSAMLTVTEQIKNYCAANDATVLAMDPGDRFTATDMLYGVGIVSAADACLALADHICGSEEAFVAKMNDKAATLGLTNTHFANCTGLDDDNNYSTVREMAVILAYALDNPFCREILSTDNRTVLGHYDKDGAEATFPRQLYNTLWGRLEGAGYEKKLPASLSCGKTLLGGKTGHTTKGKFCLASFLSDADGNLYITVTAAGETSASSVTDIDAIIGAQG